MASFDNSFVYNKNKFEDIEISDVVDLKKYNLLLPNAGSNSRIKLDEYLKNRNIVLDSVVEVSNMDTMLKLVKCGIGIGYLPNKIIEQNDDLIRLSISSLPTTDICFIYYDDNLNIAVKKLIDFLGENHNLFN